MHEMHGALQRLVSTLVPDRVAWAAASISNSYPPFHPLEEISIAAAMPKRKAEFRAGRSVARKALEMLGAPAVAIQRTSDRLPLWPPGVVGTIAHAGGMAVAMVAKTSEISAIGFDFEPTEGFDVSISSLLVRPDDEGVKDIRFSGAHLHGALHAFVIKEAGYKMIYPLTRRVIDFLDARIRIIEDPSAHAALHGRFEMEILERVSRELLLCPSFGGSWASDGHYICALATMER